MCFVFIFVQVKYDEPQENTTRTTSFALNATLDQLPGELASENTNARKQKEIVQASAASRIRETMNRVLGASSPGMDALKYWANMINTDARPIAVLALEVLSIPATSAPMERVFSQAGLATARHRNRTSFELLNHQLVVYCNMYLKNV
uniref:HAT C-terminal dimerisation domain-containing protein n=1 Tax=Ditylenchus dipsaci TaxID=166011 RepID=A0A915EI10_9BILA